MKMAKQKDDYKDAFSGFANKLKSEPINVPIQKVVAFEEKKRKEKKESMGDLHVHIPAKMLKALRIKAVQDETSIKVLVTEALEDFLKK